MEAGLIEISTYNDELMKDIIDKLTSYNIFNYLLPGVILFIVVGETTEYPISLQNNFSSAFVCYFLGMVVSRFGSLIVEPILKRTKFVKFGSYSDFVNASQIDPKIDLFSEVNNTYRTVISMLLIALMVKLFFLLENWYCLDRDATFTIILVLVLALFLFSYRKQTTYINKRVENAMKKRS
jgi:hypothetical protein